MKDRRLRKVLWGALVLAVLALALGAPAMASTDGRTVYRAMLIGNSDYTWQNDLPSCRYDLAAMRPALLSGSVSYSNVVSKANVNASGFAAAVAEMADWGADEDDVTVFYYTGHGTPEGLVGVEYVLPRDVYSFSSLQSGLADIPGKVIVLLDSCHSGGLIGKSAAAAGAGDFADNAIAAFAAAETSGVTSKAITGKAITGGAKFHVIASSAQDEFSYAIIGKSGFATSALTDAMGWTHNGAKAGVRLNTMLGDENGDDLLSVGEAYAYASEEVADRLSTYGLKQNMQVYPADSALTLNSRENITLASTNSMNMIRACIAPGSKLALSCGSDDAYWTSSRTAVASVNPATGVVTGVSSSAYTAVISARVGNTIIATCEVRVLSPRYVVSSVRLKMSALTLEQGSAYTMPVRVGPASARYKKITWTSSPDSVATVSPTGRITAVAKTGTATITATSTSGVAAACTVTVTGAAAKSVKLDQTKLSLIPGEKVFLVETVYPVTAEDKAVEWYSYNENVAKVNPDGQVTAVATGNTIIRAMTKNGKKAYCAVAVVKNQSVPRSRPRSASGKLVTSARRIYYYGGALCVDMYFSNRTGATYSVPHYSPGLLVLKLRNGELLPARMSFIDTRRLKSGHSLIYTMRASVKDYPQYEDLDLRGSDAWFEALN